MTTETTTWLITHDPSSGWCPRCLVINIKEDEKSSTYADDTFSYSWFTTNGGFEQEGVMCTYVLDPAQCKMCNIASLPCDCGCMDESPAL